MRQQRGFLVLEVVVALAIAALLTALMAHAIDRFRNARAHYAWRQAATWAADAQMQRILLGAARESLPPSDILPDGIVLDTRSIPGKGPWTGQDLVTVTARITPHRSRSIVERVSCYLPREVAP